MKYFNDKNENVIFWRISPNEIGVEFLIFSGYKTFLKKHKLPILFTAKFKNEKTVATVVSSLEKRDEIIKKIKAIY